MKVIGVKLFRNSELKKVMDCSVKGGYVKRAHGSLP